MRKMIAVLVIIAMAVIGMAGADNYHGDAKGSDDPRADLIGSNQSVVLNLSGAMSMDLWSQAVGKTGLDVIELSGTDPSVFQTLPFRKVGVGDGGSYGAWKPGI
jgi:hypothetical protein